MRLAPGSEVDRYVIVRWVGSGSLGDVYEATDPRLQRQVALKVLRSKGETHGEACARLLREARFAASFEHPNVLAVFEVAEAQEPAALKGTTYLAMEFVAGKSLRTFVGDSTVPLACLIRWLTDVARALAAAHTHGMVHPEIRTEDVIVRNDGTAKVLGFGVGNATEREPFEDRADQYAWGVMAYGLLTGLPPSMLGHTPPLSSESNKEVPLVLALAIARALSPEREQRFSTMGELVATLERLEAPVRLSSEPAPAPSEPSNVAPAVRTPPPRQVPSGRVGRAALAVGLLTAVVGVAGWLASKRLTATSPPVAAALERAPPARECRANRDCVESHGGAPFACQAQTGTCAPLESEQCKVIADPGDLQNDATVWIGVMLPARDPGRDSVELARRDFAQARRAGHGGAPIDLVECGDDTPEGAASAAEHLVRDARVPAVIGFRTSNEILDLGPRVFLPNHVAVVSADNTSPQITRIPQREPRLVWRLSHNLTAAATAIARLVPEMLEPGLHAEGRKALRVAVVKMAGFPGHDAFAETFYDEVTFNGKNARANADAYRQFSYPVDEKGTPRAPKTLTTELASFEPDVVVYFGGDPFLRGVMEPVEGILRRSPYWVTPNDFQPEVLRYAGQDPGRRKRFLAMDVVPRSPARERLVAHLNEAFPSRPSTSETADATPYDAFYLLAYAAFASGAGPLTGSQLAGAFRRLVPPGRHVTVGPEGIAEAVDALARGESLDLEGAGGHLDLDLATGEAPVDLSVQCLAPDRDGHTARAAYSGLVFDATTKRLTGLFRCE